MKKLCLIILLIWAFTSVAWGASQTFQGDITGNAATTTALQTGRTINGISFDGSANIQTPVSGGSDYTVGTYNPTLYCASGGSFGLDASSDTASYIKVGGTVTVKGYIAVTSDNACNGVLRLTLPITGVDLAENSEYAIGMLRIVDHGGTIPNPYLYTYAGWDFVSFSKLADDGTAGDITHADVDTAFNVIFNLTYQATP